jgi:penicillin-insensitive murein endopeptidase
VRVPVVSILAAALALGAPDVASAPAPRAGGLRAEPGASALSIGAPNRGRLDGGARLGEAPYLRVVPAYANSDARWGLPGLTGLVERAARRVARKFPGAVLNVGDLSRKGGGELDRHRSHESGRDADIGFYLCNAAKKQVLADRFVPFSADGKPRGKPGTEFDDARNWALVEALLDDPIARVSHIFTAFHVRARLLRYAERTGAPAQLRQRAAEAMTQPRGVPDHDDHFHVRIACPRDQHGTCVEQVQVLGTHTRPPISHPRLRRGTERPGPHLPPLPIDDGEGNAVAQAIGDEMPVLDTMP